MSTRAADWTGQFLRRANTYFHATNSLAVPLGTLIVAVSSHGYR
ncbi:MULTISPECIES: hypothetical protein [unclassified Bradyrhizobium]